MSTLLCPCGSSAPYRACCGPALRGDAPPVTAEALMRSRYTAYVRGDESYLLRTWQASHRPDALDLDDTVWLGLEVLTTGAGGPADAKGTVTFVARYQRPDGSVGALREASRFVRENGEWLYLDGDVG